MDARRRDVSEIAISGAIVALAAFVFTELPSIPAEGGYSAVGPRFAPLIVGIGLLAIGLLLLRQALTGGWRDRGPPPEEALHLPSFLWIAGGLAVQMAIVGFAGFTIASTLLFTAVARGFGSTRVAHDAIIGFVLTAAVFVFFTRVLGLSLPASPLGIL
ncbi:MAG TPA: tripartite tricarboxylate transporter TctB family protein [Casimicrobiaceae bacterium]|jgi:putative tricarboxylic transport membrane protein